MNLNNRWIGPVVLIAVLIGTSFFTVMAPSLISSLVGGEGEPARTHVEIPQAPLKTETVVIEVEGPVLDGQLINIPPLAAIDGTEPSSFTVMLVLLVIVTGAVFAFAGPIALFVMIGQRQTTALAADDSHKEAVTGLSTRLKDAAKEKNKAQPQTPKPSHDRPNVAAWATTGMVIFLSYMFGYVLGEGMNQGSGGSLANTLALLAIPLCWFYFRPEKIVDVEATSGGTVNWGTLWVALSGAIMMGLGVGLMYVVMSGGDPLPFIIWEPEPAINWEYLQELIQPLLT